MKGKYKMKNQPGFLILALAMVLAAGDAVLPSAGYTETQGTDRRQDRREDRGDARDTKQTGRQEGREVKDDCLEGDQNRPDCRQEKRDTKQDARKESRSIKKDD